jgi:hypothetical protein
MAIDTINVGNIANDGTGDDLREAFIKVNDNFTELDSTLTALPITGENLGSTGEGIFAGKEQNTLQFKEILAGSNTTVTANSTSIIIDSTGGLNSFLILSDNGSITVDGSAPLRIQGGDLIETKSPNNALLIDLKDSGIVAHDTQPALSASLQANANNIQNAGTVSASSFLGSLTGLVHGVDIRKINKYFDNNWDFGEILPVFDNVIDYVIFDTDVDMGSFIGADVADFEIDLGAF